MLCACFFVFYILIFCSNSSNSCLHFLFYTLLLYFCICAIYVSYKLLDVYISLGINEASIPLSVILPYEVGSLYAVCRQEFMKQYRRSHQVDAGALNKLCSSGCAVADITSVVRNTTACKHAA